MTWPMVKFHELISSDGLFTDGDWVESKDQDPNGNVRLIQLADIGLGYFTNKSDRYLTKEKALELNCTFLNSGDILIARMPDPIGRACIFPQLHKECVTVVDICVVRPKNENVDSKWLMHCINSREFNNQILNYVTGTTRQRISRGNLSDLNIALPPLEEQKRIAAILDKADAIRQKRQQAIALSDDFLRSVFLDMFGDPVTNPKEWDIYPLKNGITNITAGWSANGENHSCGDDEIGVLKISAVTSGIFKPNENKVVSSSNIPSNKKLVFPRKGDLLFSRANTRELVGATCIVDSDYDNVFLPDKLWVINLNSNELLPEYVHMLIHHPKFKECLTSQATGSSGSMLNISKAKFEGTLAPYPSLDVQQRFKDIFWKVMTCNALTNDTKINYDNQFNALSQKAFSGQL